MSGWTSKADKQAKQRMNETIIRINRHFGKVQIVDWNAPKDNELDKPDIHAEGLYAATVIGAEAHTTNTGKPMLKLKFKTKEGHVNGRLVFSPENAAAKRMWFLQLRNMQVGPKFFEDNPEMDDVAEACLKARCLVRIQHREFEGNRFPDVTFIDELPVVDDAA